MKASVKHVLAVSTTQEVALLAVTYPDGSGSGRNGRMEVCVCIQKNLKASYPFEHHRIIASTPPRGGRECVKTFSWEQILRIRTKTPRDVFSWVTRCY